MIAGRVLALLLLPAALTSGGAAAQAPTPARPIDNQNQSFWKDLDRSWVQERENLGACKRLNFKGISGCAQTLFTGSPFHVVVGSLAPQNGIAGGLAFSQPWHPTYCASWIDFTRSEPGPRRNQCHWAVDFSAEAEASGNGSWRAGVYAEAARTASERRIVHRPGQPKARLAESSFTGASPTVAFYTETSSLQRIFFYGLGNDSLLKNRTDFGMTETITGVDAVVPLKQPRVFDKLGLALVGEINGRFPSLRGSYGDTSPSIERVFTESTAPGLASQPGFLQFGEGVRFVPSIPRERLQLNYLVKLQEFIAPAAGRYSFRRVTADLDNTLPLFKLNRGKPNVDGAVPPVSTSRDLVASLNARMLIVTSAAGAGSNVPFYFMPTIGGSDLNNEPMLVSYPDYRFRAPNLLLLHGAYEQSLGKVPIGLFLGVDEAKVGMQRGDIGFDHLRHTYSGGFTVHAGGFPVLYVLFAWGGGEGHHAVVNLSNQLLGKSTRPSLF